MSDLVIDASVAVKWVIEEEGTARAAEAPSPSLPSVPVMTQILAALAVLCAAEATAMIVMGVSMVHWFSECIST